MIEVVPQGWTRENLPVALVLMLRADYSQHIYGASP